MTLDDARAAYPHLGLAVYALDPSGEVTLDIIGGDDDVFTFRGPTEAAAILSAFPDLAPTPSVFD